MFFSKKKTRQKHTRLLWSIKQKKNFCSKIMNASLRKKKCQDLIFAEDTYTPSPPMGTALTSLV